MFELKALYAGVVHERRAKATRKRRVDDLIAIDDAVRNKTHHRDTEDTETSVLSVPLW